MESLSIRIARFPYTVRSRTICCPEFRQASGRKNDKLPSEFMLIQEFNVSRITIRAALSEAVDKRRVLIRFAR